MGRTGWRVGSPEVGRALCHPIRTKIVIVANSSWCTICEGEKRRRVSDAAPSPFPLVRRLLKLTLSLHNHSINGTKPRAEAETVS